MTNEDGSESERRGGIGRIVALVFLLALAAFAVWLVDHIIADVRLQNCILSGRHDCAPIVPETAPGH